MAQYLGNEQSYRASTSDGRSAHRVQSTLDALAAEYPRKVIVEGSFVRATYRDFAEGFRKWLAIGAPEQLNDAQFGDRQLRAGRHFEMILRIGMIEDAFEAIVPISKLI